MQVPAGYRQPLVDGSCQIVPCPVSKQKSLPKHMQSSICFRELQVFSCNTVITDWFWGSQVYLIGREGIQISPSLPREAGIGLTGLGRSLHFPEFFEFRTTSTRKANPVLLDRFLQTFLVVGAVEVTVGIHVAIS